MISHPNKYGKPHQDLSNIQLTSESHDLIDRVIKKIFLHYTLISQLLKSFMLLSNQSCGALSCGGDNQRKNCVEKWKDGDQCVFGTLKVMIDKLHMAGHTDN